MALDFITLRNEIDILLDEIEAQYQQVLGLILTEDDLKCILYKKLSNLPSLSIPLITEDDNLLASTVHAEVPWYDENGKLTLKPDITIIEPENLSITGHRRHFPTNRNELRRTLSKSYDLPRVSKDFEFGGSAIIFELKFVRGPLGVHPGIIKKIIDDQNKIMRLVAIQEDANSILSYQVIFNKTNVKCRAFDDFLSEYGTDDRHRIIYKTGNFIPPYKKRYFLR